MNILRSFRQNSSINYIFRNIFRFGANCTSRFFSFLIQRWPVSGVVNCSFYQYSFRYFSKSDDGIPNNFYYNLKYSEETDLRLFMELSKKSKTIVDIGANTGIYAVLSSKVNPSARIFAFEPYITNADRLKINLDLNSAKNVEIVASAIGDTNGEIEIAVPKSKIITDVSSVNQEFSKNIYPEIAWDTQKVAIQRLDTFTEHRNIKIDLIKCDVETYEMLVFTGMPNVLKSHRPTILFECFFNEERQLFFNQILRDYKYFLYLILDQGLLFCKEGFLSSNLGLNYLITPVVPTQTFIAYDNPNEICKALLEHYID